MVTKRAPPIVETVTEDKLSPPISFEEIDAEDEAEAEEEASLKNYESDLDEGGSSVGSTETNYANDADYEGPLLLGPTICRVVLGTKTDLGEEVCCGTIAKDCTRRGHTDIRATQPARVAPSGIYVGKRNNKDKVDGIINSFLSEADHAAHKARDRTNIEALSQSDQKKASEALLSPKQTTVAFDTSGSPPNLSTAFASRIPTSRTPSEPVPAVRPKPSLKVNPAAAKAAPRQAPARTVLESTAELQAMIKTMRNNEAPTREAIKPSAPQHASKVQPKLAKIQEADTDKQLREALECNAKLQSMMETLISNQASRDAKSAQRNKAKPKKPAKKPHYWAVTCGWHLGIFKLPTDLEDYQNATLGFPTSKLSSRKFSTRKAATRWFDAELADSDDDGTKSSDADNSEEDYSDSSNEGRAKPSRIRGGGRKGGSSPDSSDNSSSDDEGKSDSDDDSDDDQNAIKRLRRKLTKKEIKVSKKASKPSKQTKPSKKGCKKPNRLSDILNPEALGPDASVGKDDEIFGQSLEIQSEVIDFLCPKGVTLDVQEELMESATDVCALPGKLKGDDVSSTMEALGATLSDMNSRNARRKNTIPRETQWQTSNRNALGRIKTYQNLLDFVGEFGKQRKQVLKNMRGRMTDSLFHAGWDIEEANLFYQAGLLPNVMRLTMDHYWELLSHLRNIATEHLDDWEAAFTHVLHHSEKLRVIRDNAATRNQMLFQNYVYLRDAVSKDFHSSSLTGKFTKTIQDQIRSLRTTMEEAQALGTRLKDPNNPHYTCAHCHSDIHEGGQTKCPLTKIKVKRARILAKTLTARIEEDPDNAESIIKQAVLQEK
jgi:hypothetical protein